MRPFIPAVLWAIVIMSLSVGPNIDMPQDWTNIISWDKLGHFAVYGVLTYLILWGFSKQNPQIELKIYLLGFLGSIAYGLFLELIQYTYFPNRFFEYLDILANIIGSFAGLYFFKILKTN